MTIDEERRDEVASCSAVEEDRSGATAHAALEHNEATRGDGEGRRLLACRKAGTVAFWQLRGLTVGHGSGIVIRIEWRIIMGLLLL